MFTSTQLHFGPTEPVFVKPWFFFTILWSFEQVQWTSHTVQLSTDYRAGLATLLSSR